MTAFALEFLSVTTPTAIITTLLFGGMIGAFYGYELESVSAPHYPVRFWLVGLGFVALLALLGSLGETAVSVPHSTARGVLWTFLCGSIPIGRAARIRWRAWRIEVKRRRTLRKEKEAPDG